MIIMDLFDIDFHIFTVIKFLFNLGVRIKYIYIILMWKQNGKKREQEQREEK